MIMINTPIIYADKALMHEYLKQYHNWSDEDILKLERLAFGGTYMIPNLKGIS